MKLYRSSVDPSDLGNSPSLNVAHGKKYIPSFINPLLTALSFSFNTSGCIIHIQQQKTAHKIPPFRGSGKRRGCLTGTFYETFLVVTKFTHFQCFSEKNKFYRIGHLPETPTRLRCHLLSPYLTGNSGTLPPVLIFCNTTLPFF